MRPLIRSSILFALCSLVAHPAFAAPLQIPAGNAVSNPRRDAGAGLCATGVHLTAANMLTSVPAAQFFLTQPVGMSNVDDRLTSTTLSTLNMSNGAQGAATGFTGAQPLPFSALTTAIKPNDGQNFALRLRGYISVAKAGTYTFGVAADDGYSLKIAGYPIVQSTNTDVTLRDSRQVQFSRPGLYSVEIVYFQQGGPAVLAMARSDLQDLELRSSPAPFPSSFTVVRPSDLYTAVAGTSTCAECAADTDCTGGQYCGAGLCQACADATHCGASCTPCPGNKPICDGGSCVGCTSDTQCLDGEICDTTGGSCIPRPELQFAGGCSAAQPGQTPADGPGRSLPLAALFGLLSLAVFFSAARRSRVHGARRSGSRGHTAIGAALGIAASLWAGTAQAQTTQAASSTTAANPHFNAQTYHPDVGPSSVFTVQGSQLTRSLFPYGGIVFDYANRPLRMFNPSTGENYANTVTGMFTAHLLPGVNLTPWFGLMLDVPIVLFQGFDSRTPAVEVPLQPTVAGVGDIRLVGKLQFVDNTQGGFGVAVTPEISFPSGSVDSFRSEGTIGLMPRLVIDYRFAGGTFVAANAGYFFRTSNRNVDYGVVRVSDQLRYGLGIGLPIAKGFIALAELAGAVSFSSIEGGPNYVPVEGLIGARYAHRSGIEASIGGGGGFTSAVGSPNFRIIASVAYLPRAKRKAASQSSLDEAVPPPATTDAPTNPTTTTTTDAPVTAPTQAPINNDPDGDGVIGKEDACPRDAGPRATDGCPDGDSDGVADRVDACPTDAGPADTKGCPDGDKDGVPDKADKCPALPGLKDKDGCPPENADADKDGVPDRTDGCPAEPGSADNNGCPDRDEDRDGVVDRLDKCPKVSGPKESDGCPMIEVTEDAIKLGKPIQFMQDSTSVDGTSRPMLAALARAIRDEADLKKVNIEVGASGDKKAAKALAGKRAKALQTILVDAGINKKLIQVKGAREPGQDSVLSITVVRGGAKGGKRGKQDAEAATGAGDDGKAGGRHHRRHKKK